MEKIVIDIDVQTGKAVKSVDKLNKSVTETSNTAKKTGTGLSGAFKGLSGAITGAIPMLGKLKAALISTGVGALVVAFGGLVALFKSAASVGAMFQSSLSTLKAITGGTSEELRGLNQQAKELGSTTQFTAVEVLKLQTELAKLGFTVRDIENSTPAILDLAASLEVDLASAAELAGSTVRSFGLDTEDTQRVVDVMAMSTSSSALNFDALRESLKLVAPTSNALGVSVERTTALLGVLADRGLKGSIAGTGLSKTFIELNQKGITLEQAMERVSKSSNKLNTAIDLVGVVGSKSLLGLAESGGKLGELEEKLTNSEKAARNLAEVRMDNLTGDVTKLGSAWEGFLLGLEDGDGIINKIQRGSIQLLTSAISGLGLVVDYFGFSFKDIWEQTKLVTGGSVDYVSGQFTKLSGYIKLFANQALMQFSEIPFIGKAIDKSVVENNIKEAKNGILKGVKEVEQGITKLKKASINQLTFMARFSASQEAGARRKENKKQAEIDKKIAADKVISDKKLSDEEKEALKKSREDLAKIESKSKKQAEDLEDQTALAKAKRKRERALEELEAVKLSATEKREAKKAINELYDTVEAEAKLVDDEKKKEKQAEEDAENDARLTIEREARQKYADDEIALEASIAQKKKDINLQYVGFAQSLGGLMQQLAGKNKALATAGLILEKGAAIASVVVSAQESIALAKANEAKIPFFNQLGTLTVPNFQKGASLAGTLKSIASTKIGAGLAIAGIGASAIGGGGSVPSSGTPPTAPPPSPAPAPTPSRPPAFNVVGASGTNQLASAIGGQSQQPIRTYVVSDDVSTSQQLDRNIITGATIT